MVEKATLVIYSLKWNMQFSLQLLCYMIFVTEQTHKLL